VLSQKQIDSYAQALSRMNIWTGSVRSGKTFASILKFIHEVRDGPPGNAMIIGVSRDSIQRNIIIEICNLLNLTPPTPKATQMNIFNRLVFIVGANDERAQRRIQGSTLALAYVDEITLIPQGFFKMLLSRLSVPGAQLFGTCNPDSPFHWLKTDFLDKEGLDLTKWKFTLEDNPSLTEDYINNLKSEYSGLWYKRYIEGDWVLAEGTVYDFFDESDHIINLPPGPADYYIVGMDYGTHNPTAFTMIGCNKRFYPNIWLEKEYYYDSKKYNKQKTDTDYVEDLKDFIGNKIIRAIYIDPSAASLKAEMQRQGVTNIYDSDNDILNGIRFQSKLMANGTFKICKNCTNTIREFQTYRWDEKVSLKGEDKPIKENDHALDSLRYALYTHFINDYENITSKDLDKMWSSAMGIKQDLPQFFQDTPTNTPQFIRSF
jgi:PBSX family phage terminase large subunit